jgi:predicted acylesterase/phospholipase RssA
MEYLILGPASMGIFSMLGSLIQHEEELKDIKEISGSSAGAIIGACIAIGIPLNEILNRCIDADLESFTKYRIHTLLKHFGLIDMSIVRGALIDIFQCNPTFQELEKKLYVSSYCLNRGRTEYFSEDSHPDMHVVDAVCMSISIPFLSSASKYRGMYYMDGGIQERIPVSPFMHTKHEKIFCVKLKSSESYFENIDTFKEYLSILLSSILRVRADINTERFGKTVEIDTGEYDLFSFTMSHEDKLRLFFMGMNS